MPASKPVTVMVESDGQTKAMNQGRWSPREHAQFVQGYKRHGRQWKLLAEVITTRTVLQIRTHAQKYFNKLHRNQQKDPNGQEVPAPVPRGTRKSRKRKDGKRSSTSSPTSSSNRQTTTTSTSSSPSEDTEVRRVGKHRKRSDTGDSMARKRSKASAVSLTPTKLQYERVESEPFRLFIDDDETQTTPPPSKFNPLADVSSPVSFTDFNDFLFPASHKSELDGPATGSWIHQAELADIDSELRDFRDAELTDTYAPSYTRRASGLLPLSRPTHECAELDIHTLARITESGPSHSAMFMHGTMSGNLWC